jgi:hypothetical protein
LLSKKTPAKDMQEVKNGDKIEIFFSKSC